MRSAFIIVLSLAGAAVGLGQKSFEFWPGTAYDSRIPTVHQVLGYEPGDRVSSHASILRYMDALAAASPGRMKIFEYGQTWEGRKMIYAALGSEANIKKLSEIRAEMQRLADVRKTGEAEAKRMIAGMPVLVWLSYGVHGNEISSPDAALLTAYHLLAAKNDKVVDGILAHTVVLIDPLQNPDGRDRFVNYFEQTRGLEPDPSPVAAEHQEPWPSGRVNHYLFDLNRDWIGLTQPEVLDQVKALREWLPQVYVDLHEMSADSTYFFSPEADPFNPHLTAGQRQTLQIFGRNNSKWFDHYGFDYFTRENYDAFYPGYGASWPYFYGGIAMTYEQASVRGLVVRRQDDTILAFRDTVRHHFVASISTLEAAAANREKLLEDFYHYRVSAIEEGTKEAVKEYILPRSRDASATDKLAGILVEHGIEVKRATEPFRAGDRSYPTGTYVVPLAQPAKRLVRTLLDPQTPLDEQFMAREEERRKLKQRSEIYDVTAWSLPLLFNVEAVPAEAVTEGRFEPAKPVLIQPGEMHGGPASVAYLVPWGSEAAGRLLAAALRQDLKVFTSDKPLAQNGTKYPAGTLIFKVAGNPADLGDRLARLARETGADVFGANSGWVDEGVNFGSHFVLPVRRPTIAMAWDTPSASTSAGAARFVLERQYGYPVTPVRISQLNQAELARFQVLILPEGGGYAGVLGESGIARIKDWVQAGGTIVALGSAVNFLCSSRVGLLDTTAENALREGEDKEKKGGGGSEKSTGPVPGTQIASEAEYQKTIRAASEPPDSAPGAIVRARIRSDHWLTAGVADTVNAMIEGRAIYSPLKADKGINAVYFDAPDKLLLSGFLWSDNRKQMPFKPLVLTQNSGRGIVVGFTADPNFRAMQDGLNVLFLNAVFRGPAHAR